MVPSLRPSREHRFTVRPLGAGGAPSRRIIPFFYFSLHPERKASRQAGGQVAPPLRVSNEHILIVRVPRARGAIWLPDRPFFAPSKRVTGLPFTARVQRGPSEAARCASKKGKRLPATSFSAHPSTLSPPSPSSAPRPWPVPAPSRRRGVVAERFRQRPSCALHLF